MKNSACELCLKEAHQGDDSETELSPVYHDRLARAIATVVRDPHFWRSGTFYTTETLPHLGHKYGTYNRQRLLDWIDDYLQDVSGTPGATGQGIPERATRGVTAREWRAAKDVLKALNIVGD